MHQLHLKIFGRVQGVCFRSYTQRKAIQLGLTGWVKNCDDRTVEILAEGEENILKEFLAWCHEGSPGSSVNKITESWQPINQQNQEGFHVKHNQF